MPILFKRRRRNEDKSQWSKERWQDHLISTAQSESERQEIYAMFSRES